jgi:hypothetical protein
MGVTEWAQYQHRKERRPSEATMPVRRLYPEPKKDRREPKERKK